MKYLILVLLLGTTGGCATTEVINQIPAPRSEQDKAHVTVCRQRIFYGDAAATIISLDRRPILRSAAGKCFSAKVDPGTHIVSVMAQGPMGPEVREIEFDLRSGEAKYFKTKYEKIIESTHSEITELSGYEQILVQ